MAENFLIELIASLKKNISKKQIREDAKNLGDIKVPLIGTLNKTKTRTQLKRDLESLNGTVNLQGKVDKKGIVTSVQQATQQAQKQANAQSIRMDFSIRKDKLVNDIKLLGQQNSKLFKDVGMTQKYNQLLDSAKLANNTKELQNLRLQLGAFRSELKVTGNSGMTLLDALKNGLQKTLQLFGSYGIIMQFTTQLRNAWKEAKELDSSLTDLARVNAEISRSGFPDYLDKVIDKTKQLGVAVKDYIQSVTTFSRAGYNLADSEILSSMATQLQKVGDMSAESASKALLSGLQGYEKIDGYGMDQLAEKAQALNDKIDLIGNTASISQKEVAEGIQAVGSVMNDANTSVDEFIAMLGAGNRAVQDSNKVALAIRTSALRIRGCTAELEEMGETTDDVIESTSTLAAKIKALTNIDGIGGVNILEADEETFRSIYDIYNDISKVYSKMSDVDASALLDLIAGKNRSNQISAVLNNMSEANELLNRSLNATGTASAEYEIYLDSAEAAVERFGVAMTETYSNILNGETVKSLTNAGTAVLDFANSFGILEGVFKGFLTLGILKGITALSVAFKNSAVQASNFGKALNTANELSQLTSGTQKYSNALSSLKDSCVGLTDAQLKQVLANNALSESQRLQILSYQGLTRVQAKEKLTQMGLTDAILAQNAANDAAAASTFSFSAAVRGLGTSIKMAFLSNPIGITIMGISTAISLATVAFSKIKQSQEELLQSTKESANAYKESASSIDDYTKRYQELREALLAAKGNEEETYNVKKQLLDLQTELNDKFGEEYGAINLVTEAYKDQTEVIKSLNKEAAQTFLNENQKGIRQSTAKMTDNNHYNLSYTGMISESDEGKILKEIAEKYKEQGVSVLEELDEMQFSIHLDADPQSAYKTIQAFENDVRDKARELGDEHLFDDVLEISSASLNDAKSTIDEYGDIYRQALTADIVSDDSKAKVYNDALEAVKAYNEAVLQSEDIYNDGNVEKARQSLQALHDEINNNEAWEKYGFLIDDVFDQADTRLLDFNNALKSDSRLKELTKDLKGLSDLDLKALNENIGDNTSFDKLKESAENYNISVDELIDSLVRLGVVQGEIVSESSDMEEPKWDYSTTLENLDKVKDSLDVLDKTFAKLFDADELIGFEDLSSINEAFKDIDGIEDYIRRIQEAGQNTEEVSRIFGELTGAYLEHTGVLANVTEENKNLIISMLEEMGIANAEEIVLAQLSAQHEVLALQKQFLAQTGHELIEATIEEINQFLAESDASDIAKQSLAQLALEKIDLSNIQLDESGNISQLISLANAAGASATAVAKAQQAINTINTMNKNGANGSAGDFHRLDNATLTVGQIKNNTYDWQYEKLDPNDFIVTNSPKYTPKYKGGSNTNKAIEQAKKDAEKETKKAAKEAEKEFEKEIDFFERRIQVLTDAFSNLEKGMENVFGADAKNTLLSAQIGILDEEINNYTDALAMYRQKANEALSGVSDDLRDKIVNGAVQITDFIGDGNEEVVEAMEAYEGWADKVADCTQKLEELKTQIRQLELQKFNNIVEDFTNQFDIHGDAIDLISKQIGLLEEAGQLIGESFYTKQIEQSKKQLNTLESEKTRLVEQMNEALTSGRIQKGTDEWLEMVSALSDVEGNILDCKTAIEEFDNELLNLNWQIFERVQTEFGNISSELDNLAGLFDDFNDIRVSDGKGTWTKQAIATLGLYAQQYELAQYQVGQYGEAIDRLNQDYAAGRYSATEYADKLADLVKGQWDAVNSAESLEDAVYDLNKTRVDEEIKIIEDEIDAYKKLTDAQIKALDAAQSLHEYEQSIAEKTKAVTDMERQLAAMQNDSTSATVAKRKQLEEQLAEAKKALSEEEYQHSIETQKNALNEQYEAFEGERNKEIEALQLTLEDKEKLIADSLEIVKANAATVGEEIAMIAQEHGVIVSDSIISAWQSGENAIASYGAVLTDQSSAFIGNIMGVQDYVYGLQAQANSTADSLSWMFSTRADNLVNELTSSYYSEANLNAMANTLQNSLINTLERGYDVSSITSALSSIASGANSVADAANKAAQALASMGAAQTGAGAGSGSDSGSMDKGYKVVDTKYGRTIRTYPTRQEADDYIRSNKSTSKYFTVMKAAKGGIVTKDKNNPLNRIAEAVGEDTMIAAKDGEGVLTRRQTEAVSDLAETIEGEKLAVANGSGGIADQDQFLTFEEFVALHNKNNPGTQFYPLQRSINGETDKLNTQLKLSDGSQLIPAGVRNMNVNIPEFVKTDRQGSNVNIRYDSLVTVNGDINDTKHFTKQITGCIENTLNRINRDFAIHCR